MVSRPDTHTQPPSAPSSTRSPAFRLRLKPAAPVTGYVDGAWWPRSRDLTVELAALAEGLVGRIGRLERVTYALSAWDAAPRGVAVDGSRVRLEGFTYQDQNVLHAIGSNGGRVSLLVVPPDTAGAAGRAAMTTAGDRGNADLPEEILAAAALPVPRQATDRPAERWENDGGHPHHRA